ncbi:hypothetical protein QCE73_26710 [Caballeronia sp. LZ029]|uniref:hypothetical protein n=1 Tax=Caballeronia sp. LZ029 TaxID=3038564 RepID=UPI002856B6D3|nr:hypothetical protein [Caballeronia sp. LZ029]MDR5746768.1 hypothetical protein [Caballeronia sp. LZ029]
MKARILLAFVCTALSPYAVAGSPFAAVFADTTTTFFILLNAALTCYFLFYRFNRFAVVHGPEILTTVGILGCFLGIALALLHFDASNVAESVPHLLEGVKTAFWASVSGVLGSLFIRARHGIQTKPIPQPDGAPKSATLDDVVAATQALQRSLSGTEEGSLLSQLKLMRQEQGDESKQLRSSFDTFAKRMSEDGSKALIEALKEVIRDFNAQINEQFGENFKHLNAAVGNLVVWQQQYKEELDKLQALQKSSADDLRQSAGALASFIDRASRFSDVASALDTTLQGLVRQHQEIDASQRSMAAVLTEMKDVTPEFARKIDEMTDSMKQSVARLQSDISESVKLSGTQLQLAAAQMKDDMVATLKQSQVAVAGAIEASGNHMQATVGDVKNVLSEALHGSQVHIAEIVRASGVQMQASVGEVKDLLSATLQKSQADIAEIVRVSGTQMQASVGDVKNILAETVKKSQADAIEVVKACGTQMQASSAELKDLLDSTLKKSQSEVNESLGKSMEHIRQGVVTLDKGLQEELTKSLESLGRQLASLSEKFVSDYGPLTDRLRDVVRMAGTA